MFSIGINGIFWQEIYLVFSKIDISKTTRFDRTSRNFFLVIFCCTFLRVVFTFLSLEGFLLLPPFETKLVSIMINFLLEWLVDVFRIISKSISGDVRQAVKMVFSNIDKSKTTVFYRTLLNLVFFCCTFSCASSSTSSRRGYFDEYWWWSCLKKSNFFSIMIRGHWMECWCFSNVFDGNQRNLLASSLLGFQKIRYQ